MLLSKNYFIFLRTVYRVSKRDHSNKCINCPMLVLVETLQNRLDPALPDLLPRMIIAAEDECYSGERQLSHENTK